MTAIPAMPSLAASLPLLKTNLARLRATAGGPQFLVPTLGLAAPQPIQTLSMPVAWPTTLTWPPRTSSKLLIQSDVVSRNCIALSLWRLEGT